MAPVFDQPVRTVGLPILTRFRLNAFPLFTRLARLALAPRPRRTFLNSTSRRRERLPAPFSRAFVWLCVKILRLRLFSAKPGARICYRPVS